LPERTRWRRPTTTDRVSGSSRQSVGDALRAETLIASLVAVTGWRRVAGLSAVAFVVRAAYLLVWAPAGALRSDAAHYHEIAAHLAAGEGFTSTFPQLSAHATAFRPPLYPAVLGTLYRIVGASPLAGRWLNVLIGIGVVLLADRVASRLRGPAAGLVAGLLVAISPSLVANDVNVLAEPLGLLLLLAVWLHVDRGRWVLAASLTGAMVLTRPSAQLVAIVLVAWVAHRAGLRRAAGFGAIVVLVVAPWLVRNELDVHTWRLYTSNGFNLAAMYSEPAQATHAFVDPVHDPRFEYTRFDQFDEAQWDRTMSELGIAGLRQNPTYVIENVARNTGATFELHPSYNDGPEFEDGRNADVRRVGLPLFYVLTVTGVAGWWKVRRTPLGSLIAVSACSFVAISLLLVAPPRLRAPWDLACCIGAAIFAVDTVNVRRARRRAARRVGGQGAFDRALAEVRD